MVLILSRHWMRLIPKFSRYGFNAVKVKRYYGIFLDQINPNIIQALVLTESNIDSIHAIKNMTFLTELIIRFSDEDGPPVDLVRCLEACPPSMKSFAITYDRMVVKPLNIILESIETLEIRSSDLTTELGDIISFCFPNLVKLTLVFQYLQDTNITQKSSRLQHATFSRYTYALENNSEYGLSFKSPTQSEPKHYICDGQQKREV